MVAGLAVALVLLLGGCGSDGYRVEVPTPAMEPAIEAGSSVAVDLDAFAAGSQPKHGDRVVMRGGSLVVTGAPVANVLGRART